MGAVLMSQVVMYLDDALILAYVFCPHASIHMWAFESEIKWRNNKRHFMVYVLSNIVFILFATLFVLEVLSFEKTGVHSIDYSLLNAAVEFIAAQNKI
jgi:hypothetical protein